MAIADEATPWTEVLLDRVEAGEEILVPAHWPLEVVKRPSRRPAQGARNRRTGREFLEDLAALPIRVVPAAVSAELPAIVSLAKQYRLAAYDAAYLELPQRTGFAAGDPRRRPAPSGYRGRRCARGASNMNAAVEGLPALAPRPPR